MDKGKIDKTKTAAVATFAAASVLVGGAFSSPTDLMEDECIFSPTPIVQNDDDASYTSGGDDPDEEDRLKRGVKGGIRRLVFTAPPAVRACVGIPLWGIGRLILSLAETLWASALSPAASTVLGWLGTALLAVLVFALAVKTVFPDMPLRKILNKRSISTVVILVLGFAALDTVLPYFWNEYAEISKAVSIAASLTAAAVPTAFFLKRELRRRRTAVRASEKEDAEAETRRIVKELADSVCR